MTKKKRWIIFLASTVLFLVVTPYLTLYSLGYRIDFENKTIRATGGIYVRALPQGADIIIDSSIENKTGIFSNSVFVQNLLPKNHSVLIKKDGYYDYQKTIKVKEKEVIKLENVILFKKDILFSVLQKSNYFSIAPNNITLVSVKVLDQLTARPSGVKSPSQISSLFPGV